MTQAKYKEQLCFYDQTRGRPYITQKATCIFFSNLLCSVTFIEKYIDFLWKTQLEKIKKAENQVWKALKHL